MHMQYVSHMQLQTAKSLSAKVCKVSYDINHKTSDF